MEMENKKLQKMSEAMKELSKNIVTLTREEEMLAMKMQVHDDLGYSVLAAHRMLAQDCEENQKEFLQQWNRILNLLKKDNESAEGKIHQKVQERADALGMNLCFTGEMPQDPQVRELLDVILLEAVSNGVRHAGATELYVNMSSENGQWKFVITNNGEKPVKEIEEGGGLLAIRKKVEMRKGVVRLNSLPEYSLTILLPKEEVLV
ncbi:MAG: hypothetical protein SOZ59_16245 [Candidatus Limivivens sp.]|nr:hypothetical protein [Candidatus Limivivens sp.]